MNRLILTIVAACFVAAACSSSDGTASDGDASGSDADRCQRNTDAGTITVVTGFDFAASPGIIDPIVADDQGYFDELCLDVEIQPGFAPSNHGLVASGAAQFSTADSFGEIAAVNTSGEAGLVAVLHYGKTAVQALVVPADSPIATVQDLRGTTIGIKGALPYPVQIMLGSSGVTPGTYDELLLDTFDPVAGFELGIDALPVYKSNEPIQLDNAGFAYRMFDPSDEGTPASFGLVVTSQEFLDSHPEVVSDYVLASLKGMEYAIANPDEAVQAALDRINNGDNPAFLGDQTEGPRWEVERALVVEATPAGEGIGVVDPDALGAEVSALTDVGTFSSLPDWEKMIAPDVAAGNYDGDALVWPEQ